MRTPSIVFALVASLPVLATAQGAPERPRIDERVAQIPQSALGAPWAFIGYAVTPPVGANWLVAVGTPRGGTMGRQAGDGETAVLVLASELLPQPVESDTALLELARTRHARLGERWSDPKHEEAAVRHGGTRCARHTIEGRDAEIRSPRKDADKANAARSWIRSVGLSCIHPTDARLLVEVAVSERSTLAAMSPEVRKDAEALMSSLVFHRYTEDALQKSAEAARAGGLAAAETVLKPYIDADAAWARYFMAQILERAVPAPGDAGPRLSALLEPAAERGLAGAQWVLGRLYLRGAPGLDRDPAKAEPLLRRAAERGHPAAAFQLGLSLLSGAEGIPANNREGALWIQRAAFRGQKEAREMLEAAVKPESKGGPAASPR